MDTTTITFESLTPNNVEAWLHSLQVERAQHQATEIVNKISDISKHTCHDMSRWKSMRFSLDKPTTLHPINLHQLKENGFRVWQLGSTNKDDYYPTCFNHYVVTWGDANEIVKAIQDAENEYFVNDDPANWTEL